MNSRLSFTRRRAFTLVEMMVVVGMLAILMSLGVVNLLKTQQSARITSTVNQLAADLRGQQLKSMTGDTDGTGTISAHGLYIQPTSYTLIRGYSYSASDPANFTVNLESGLALSTSFPSPEVVFLAGSGELSGYTPGSDTFTLIDTASTASVTFQFNRYGVIISNY